MISRLRSPRVPSGSPAREKVGDKLVENDLDAEQGTGGDRFAPRNAHQPGDGRHDVAKQPFQGDRRPGKVGQQAERHVREVNERDDDDQRGDDVEQQGKPVQRAAGYRIDARIV